MDLKQTGKFIQDQRKFNKLTQLQLAEKLCVSEKTISKWECGKGFPDTSLILPLCKELNITANELLSGKTLRTNEEYRNLAEENLVTLKNQNEQNSRHLLSVELVLIWFSLVIFFACIIPAAYIELAIVWRVLLLVFGFLNLFLAIYFSILIETKAGFYECPKCKHKHIPSYNQVLWSMHMGRTRYLKCPNCNQKSWQKKKIK